jgi:4-carboxymuconolactone decarboxylase
MRLKPLAAGALTEEQKTVMREAEEGRRGHVPKPMLGWLGNPEMARRAQHLGALLRYETTLAGRLSELAILVTARHWSAAYAWQAHKREALKCGLDGQIIADIAARKKPRFDQRDAEIVYEFSSTLLARHRVDDALYQTAVAQFGERGIAEIVGIIGYYSLVCLTLNTFEFDMPEGQTPEISHDD